MFGKSTHIHLTKVMAIIQTDVLGEVLTFLYIYFQIGDNVYVKFGGISELLVVNCLYKLFSFVLVHLCDMITFSEKKLHAYVSWKVLLVMMNIPENMC